MYRYLQITPVENGVILDIAVETKEDQEQEELGLEFIRYVYSYRMDDREILCQEIERRLTELSDITEND